MGGEGISAGSGSSRSLTDSDPVGTLGFPPRVTGGGISSSLTGFPFRADINMDCGPSGQGRWKVQVMKFPSLKVFRLLSITRGFR